MTVVGIVPAGGSGERLGADRPKAFVVCAGKPMVEWSVEALSSVCARVVVAVPPGHEDPPDRVTGGASRSASVRNALAAAPEATVVVVHDAARPLVTAELVRECLEALDGVDGVIAASPVSDTIHVASPDLLVADSPDRVHPLGRPDPSGVPRGRRSGGRSPGVTPPRTRPPSLL